MNLSDAGNPVFEALMADVRGATLNYREARVQAPAKETAFRRFRKERDRATLAAAIHKAHEDGLGINAIAAAYGSQDVRTVGKLIAEHNRRLKDEAQGLEFFQYSEEDMWWLR